MGLRETVEIVYTWPDGREEVRYRRPLNTESARKLMDEVQALHDRAEVDGYESPYSVRLVV